MANMPMQTNTTSQIRQPLTEGKFFGGEAPLQDQSPETLNPFAQAMASTESWRGGAAQPPETTLGAGAQLHELFAGSAHEGFGQLGINTRPVRSGTVFDSNTRAENQVQKHMQTIEGMKQGRLNTPRVESGNSEVSKFTPEQNSTPAQLEQARRQLKLALAQNPRVRPTGVDGLVDTQTGQRHQQADKSLLTVITDAISYVSLVARARNSSAAELNRHRQANKRSAISMLEGSGHDRKANMMQQMQELQAEVPHEFALGE